MTAMRPFASTGFYGKLPCVGDFVRRRLPDAFVTPWDEAMQRLLIAAAADDEATEPDTSPGPWRFALAPGVCGPEGWIGSVAAGCDRVGRSFPLAIAATVAAGAAHEPAWFDAAEALHDRLSDGQIHSVDDFDSQCARLIRDERPDPMFAAWWNVRQRTQDADRTCLWWRPMTKSRPAAWLLSGGLRFADDGRGLRIAAPASHARWNPVPAFGAAMP